MDLTQNRQYTHRAQYKLSSSALLPSNGQSGSDQRISNDRCRCRKLTRVHDLRLSTHYAFLCDPVGWNDGHRGTRFAGTPAGRWFRIGADGEHLYSPEDNLERSELARLDTATRTIDIAMYSFTDRYLAEELAALARKGVRIRVYRDREQFTQENQWGTGTATGILLAAGVEVRVKGARDLMHLKSYAIDGRLLRTGSANWSPTGLKRQDNDVVYESSPEAVERFERKFEEMWVKSTKTTATVSEY